MIERKYWTLEIASNIERKFVALNVRRDFQCPAYFHAKEHFSEERGSTDFRLSHRIGV